AREPRELAALLERPQLLGSGRGVRPVLDGAAEVLRETYGAAGVAVALAEEPGGHLRLAAAAGLPAGRRASVHLKPGEAITGRVVASGKPVVVPEVSREPLLRSPHEILSAADAAKKELSLVAVPLVVDRKAVGALALVLPHEPERDFPRKTAFLKVVASLLGQAMHVERLIEAERRRLLDENQKLKRELKGRYELKNLVGHSRPMEELYEQVAQAAPSDTTVLIRGESGTGKELIAHAIHYNSPRAGKPFVKVSCAALPESLIESELFGHEMGAFTDARAQKKGRFELADGGTLFLDEVGDLSTATQVKLLRVLQEREFERLGGVAPIAVDVRLVAATNRDLEVAMARGAFREDLFYRLNVFAIFVPPLRDRRTDVPLLADHFVEKYAVRHRRDVRRISTPAIDMLMSYHWPGNVRELENAIERAVLVCDGGVLHAHHLPPTLQTAEVSGTLPRQSLAAATAAFEKDLLLDALKIARGNRAKAARLLRTTERIFGYRLKRLGIDASRFRS
ncbi:MAG TPA: sigma 54-interacting transcriptional regulator, partial [Thermoanaerobaculia bacterium]|nr:sigma 54-interacting transcriptional regulator [Thermoanaerobaculia bacterium]